MGPEEENATSGSKLRASLGLGMSLAVQDYLLPEMTNHSTTKQRVAKVSGHATFWGGGGGSRSGT